MEHGNEHPSIVVRRTDGAARAQWKGILTCGHIWTCPVCSQNLKAERATRIVRAVDHLAGRWQMLTITLRHRPGMNLKALRDGMAAAWRRTRQGGRIQRVWSGRVSASIRSAEVTYGEGGWHPHLHVLLRTSEWTLDERAALEQRWADAIVKELGKEVRPSDVRGLVWSAPFAASRESGQRATYLAKMGLESAGLAKSGRRGSLTPWQVAERATAGDDASKRLWWEYIEATRGRRAIELDDRAQAAAEAALELLRAEGRDTDEAQEPLRIEIQRDDVRALRWLERRVGDIFALVLRAAEEGGRAAVDQWIAYARQHAELRRNRGAPFEDEYDACASGAPP